MAESAVGQVVGRLAVLLADEVKLAKELRDSMTTAKDKLEWIQSFLKDADRQRREQTSEGVRVWVKQIRDATYNMEDVLDEYLLKVEQQQQQQKNFFQSFIDFLAQLFTRHDLVERIKQINDRLDQIKANKDMFTFDNSIASSLSSRSADLDLPGRNELENAVVGFDKDVNALIERLTDPNVLQCTVTSIVGMGGLGKTTLAARVYHDKKIKSYFGCQAWVSISQVYQVKDVLGRILEQVTGEDQMHTGSMTERALVEKLSKKLEKERYMVVIDDIWDIAAWESIKVALPQGQKGSKVLLTTRQAQVARHADPFTPACDLNLLGPDDSWDLFCKRAFQSGHCPTHLEPLQETILSKCGGLPLALVALGGILQVNDPSYDAWDNVLEQLPVELRREDGIIKPFKILTLSYDVLPHHLKPCFLYFAAYPEGSEIDAQTLMRLWIAEGFMQPKHGQTMEVQAEDSLKELIQRSMIIVKEKIEDGSIIEVRIHDFYLELARSEAEEVNFLLAQCNRYVLPPPSTVRRLSLSTGVLQSLPTAKLRTLLSNWRDFPSSFVQSKLLRVIDLYRLKEVQLPKEIGGLILLRYLGMKKSRVRKLPSSIGNLRNLQTFDVSGSSVTEVPSTFWRIPTLRHVLVESSMFEGKPELSSCLNDLQTLEGVRSGRWVRNGGLGNMPNLQKLSLSHVNPSECEALLESLEKLEFLTRLGLHSSEFLPEEVLTSSRHRHLRTLCLMGELRMCRLDPIPTSTQILPSLCALHLSGSLLKDITMIAALPSLRYLQLVDKAYVGTVLICPSGGFSRLTTLELVLLDGLEELEVEDGALPCLQRLHLSNCSAMRMLPAGLRHVTTLQTLELFKMPIIEERIKQETGDDYPKIQHIPYVYIEHDETRYIRNYCRRLSRVFVNRNTLFLAIVNGNVTDVVLEDDISIQ